MVNSQIIENIKIEAHRIEEDTEHSSKSHYNASTLWGRFHYWLGIPMSITAALAGITAIQELPMIATLFAVASTVLGTLQTFINPGEKSNIHKSAGDHYLTLRNETRCFREIEMLNLSPEEARERILIISDERNALNESSPIPPRSCFERTRKDIEEGHTQYRVDKQEG